MSRGKITVGYGTAEQRELEIVDFVQAEFKDHRLISISQIEDGSLVAVVENPVSSGRNTQATIWLSKESFVGMLSAAFLYFSAKGEDLGELMKSVIESEYINYTYSDNLTAISIKQYYRNKKINFETNNTHINNDTYYPILISKGDSQKIPDQGRQEEGEEVDA